MTDVVGSDRVGGLDGIGRNITLVFEAIIDHSFGTVVAIPLIVTVFTKVMVEADAIRQSVLVYVIHKRIHGLKPNDVHVSADGREHQPIRSGIERIAAVIQPQEGFHY